MQTLTTTLILVSESFLCRDVTAHARRSSCSKGHSRAVLQHHSEARLAVERRVAVHACCPRTGLCEVLLVIRRRPLPLLEALLQADPAFPRRLGRNSDVGLLDGRARAGADTVRRARARNFPWVLGWSRGRARCLDVLWSVIVLSRGRQRRHTSAGVVLFSGRLDRWRGAGHRGVRQVVPPLFVRDAANDATLLAPLRMYARTRRLWWRRRDGSLPVEAAFATPPENGKGNDERSHDTAHDCANDDAGALPVVTGNDVGDRPA